MMSSENSSEFFASSLESSETFQQLRVCRKQPAANFFDFEDDEDQQDEIIVQTSEIVKLSSTKVPSDNVKYTNNLKTNHDGKKSSTNLFGEMVNFQTNERIQELIESTVNAITSKQISSLSNSPTKQLSPRQAVDKIFAGDHDINLQVFRGKEQKLELLDYAVLTGDKNTITMVIHYLEQTLKSSIFLYELIRRPVAADHYLLYLRSTEQFDQQMNMLNVMGRYEDAAMITYGRACRSTAEPQQQVRMLERALLSFTAGGQEVTQWQSYIREHITLLEQQLPIEADDRRREEEAKRLSSTSMPLLQSSNHNLQTSSTDQQSSIKMFHGITVDDQLFVIYPRPSTLVGLPLMETLGYCCLYHHHLPDNNFASPQHLRKTFHLTDRQFLWTSLQSLSKTGRWQEIDNLFEYKSWLGSRKIRNVVPITDIVQILYQNSSPPEMLEKYLDLVDDVERRLQLAKEFHMNKYAADILIKLRDRKRLGELRQMIRTKCEMDYVQRYIDNALVTSSIKWKN